MGWWPFSSPTTGGNASKVTPPQEATLASIPATQSLPTEPTSATLETTKSGDSGVMMEKSKPYKSLESRKQPSGAEGWQSYQEMLKPIAWPNGISEWPVLGLSALFVASATFPSSVVPGLPPRLARLAFGGAFATSGLAIRSGDESNGASIATWWSASHILLSSIYKTYRKELAKKLSQPLPVRSSPVAWVLTSATVATGVAYGVAL